VSVDTWSTIGLGVERNTWRYCFPVVCHLVPVLRRRPEMTQDELKGHIYSAIEKSGKVLQDTLGDNAEKNVVVVPVVVVISNCIIQKE